MIEPEVRQARARRRAWRTLGAGMLTAAVLALAACGGDDDEGEPQAAATGTTPAAGADYVAEAQQRVDAIFAGNLFKEPPATSPAPQRGKNVWHISVGLSLPAGVQFADGMKSSAKELGWDLTVFDGKLSPDSYQDGIRQAIAEKADGIVLYTIDCSLVKAALQQAKRADIPVVAASSYDCNQQDPAEPSLFTQQTTYLTEEGTGDAVAWARALGAAEADWIVARTDGKAKVILFNQKDVQYVIEVNAGFQERFKRCTECQIVRTVEHTLADLGPKLQQKAEQALLQTPEANAVVAYYDDLMTAGVGAAINGSGRNDELFVVAGGGYEANLDLVRKNQGQDAGYAYSINWEGWSSADTLNRLFAGEEPASSGNGVGLFDAEHNLGTSGPFQVNIDYASAYQKAWADAAG